MVRLEIYQTVLIYCYSFIIMHTSLALFSYNDARGGCIYQLRRNSLQSQFANWKLIYLLKLFWNFKYLLQISHAPIKENAQRNELISQLEFTIWYSNGKLQQAYANYYSKQQLRQKCQSQWAARQTGEGRADERVKGERVGQLLSELLEGAEREEERGSGLGSC